MPSGTDTITISESDEAERSRVIAAISSLTTANRHEVELVGNVVEFSYANSEEHRAITTEIREAVAGVGRYAGETVIEESVGV